MKRAVALVPIWAALLSTAACGGDNTTTFVLQSDSPTPSTTSSPNVSASASSSPSAALPETAATPIADGRRIIIDSPDGGSSISSPVVVLGTASVDNGTVVAVVLDGSGNELGRATTTASASKPDFGHFDVSVDFSGATAGAKGQIKVFGVNPRDGKTPTFYYFITVRFS
jgi:hypothetical protein